MITAAFASGRLTPLTARRSATGRSGQVPGLVVVGGVLSSAASYGSLAERLARYFEVHLVNRRGRAGSGPQRPGHSIEDECEDLLAVMNATGASVVFGHSFGGLVALEAARRGAGFETVFVYEPGVPLYGQFDLAWLEGYERLLERGDRRGAFAWMVKHAGFGPKVLRVMPLWYVRAVLRLGIRSQRWASMEPLLDANLAEHRIQAALDAPSAERFSAIAARTVLMCGTRSPDFIARGLLAELAEVIPDAVVAVLPRLGHLDARRPSREDRLSNLEPLLTAHTFCLRALGLSSACCRQRSPKFPPYPGQTQ